jgi:hypothetical protein
MRRAQSNVAGAGRLANDDREKSRLERGRVETRASSGSEKGTNKDPGAIMTGDFHIHRRIGVGGAAHFEIPSLAVLAEVVGIG